MKPPVEDKLVISLMGFEREEDTTALILSVLRNVDGEGHEIYDCEDSHWYQRLPTLDSRRFHDNTKQKQ